MRTLKTIVIAVGLTLFVQATPVRPQVTSRTYDAVVKGMTCKQQTFSDSLQCDYRVGKSLYFTIAGVGDPDAGITFMSSSFEGDYYGSVGLLHGCVIVTPGRLLPGFLDMAFVSPRTGKVYSDWATCGNAK